MTTPSDLWAYCCLCGNILFIYNHTVSQPKLVFHYCSIFVEITERLFKIKAMSCFCPLQAQLCVLLESSKDLLSHGAFCPKLLWQEYRRDQVCVCVYVCLYVCQCKNQCTVWHNKVVCLWYFAMFITQCCCL